MFMKIAIAGEVCSFSLMKEVKKHLISKGYEVLDLGMTDEKEPMVFYETAPKVARAIQNGEAERGILMCGTGMGVCICANKFKGIYAGLANPRLQLNCIMLLTEPMYCVWANGLLEKKWQWT